MSVNEDKVKEILVKHRHLYHDYLVIFDDQFDDVAKQICSLLGVEE